MEWLEYVKIIISIAGITIVFFGLKGVRTQIQASMFSDYTKRYAEVIDGLPFGARSPSSVKSLDDFDETEQQRIIGTVRRYLNLVSEEMYLAEEKFIADSAWIIWKTGIQDTMRLSAFAEVWKTIRDEYDAYPEFQRFIEELD